LLKKNRKLKLILKEELMKKLSKKYLIKDLKSKEKWRKTEKLFLIFHSYLP
tara:strand:+ start:200 stop:352 length:153 start_codon:yes stop_codon:yes gene_type:complete